MLRLIVYVARGFNRIPVQSFHEMIDLFFGQGHDIVGQETESRQ